MRGLSNKGATAARMQTALALCCVLLGGTGCVVHETKPQPHVALVQANEQIPQDQLLDVVVHPLDPGIPPGLDPQALEKKLINPDIRQAESRYMANLLAATITTSGEWGAVRVAPEVAQYFDVTVQGKILESTGAKLALEITVKDATGRIWINARRYESPADTGSYKTDAALKARDPFQNVYTNIANDMMTARKTLKAAELRDIHRVAQLEFAVDLAPQAMGGYLATQPNGQVKVVRLPAQDDPMELRIDRIRERDAGIVDTVNGYYANFSDQMASSYGEWRRASFEEIDKEQRALNQARARTYLGAAAVLASVLMPNQCGVYDLNCQRVQQAARYAGAVGGTAAFLSGLKKYSDAKVHAQTLKEMSETFQSEVAPQVVDVEGRTLKLTGTADEQYRQWREMLHQLYLEQNGTPTHVEAQATPVVPSPVPPVAADAAH